MMKMINLKRALANYGAIIYQALMETIQADYPEPSGGQPRTPFMVVDASVIADMEPQEQAQARNTLNLLLSLTRAKLGPGEWLQVIRRNKYDGRFAPGPETEGDLFDGSE